MKKYGKTKKIALTGGPGVGKSSIIGCLKELGYPVRDEVFTRLFAKAQEEGRFNDKFLHSKELIHDLVKLQVELEQAKDEQILFLDRSRIDIWGFAKNMGIVPESEDQAILEKGDYDLVFLVEPMPREFYDQNSIRRQTYDESIEHHRANEERSTEYLLLRGKDPSVNLIRVPFQCERKDLSVLDRTHFILKRI